MAEIQNFHVHIYYDASSYDQASKLCDEAGQRFNLPVGHKHKQAVGPHPCWSCQLTLSTELFGEVIPWLALNRQGLTIFIHANTGNDLKDHTEYTLWMGTIEPLNLDIFSEKN